MQCGSCRENGLFDVRHDVWDMRHGTGDMDLMVNGVKQAVSDGTTAAQLLETLKIVPERVVVELNLKILKRAELANTALKEGDQVEIVHFVGGGCSQTVPRAPNPELRHG